MARKSAAEKAKEEKEQKKLAQKKAAQKTKLSLSKKNSDPDEEEDDEEDDDTNVENSSDKEDNEENEEEVISQDEDEDYEELVTQDDIDAGKVDPVDADIRNAPVKPLSDEEKKNAKGKRDAPAARGEDVEEVDDTSDKDKGRMTEIRLTKRVGVGTRIGSWSWAEGVGVEGHVDEVFKVPYFAAVHLSGCGVAVAYDKSIPHFSSVRTNTRPVTTKFLR